MPVTYTDYDDNGLTADAWRFRHAENVTHRTARILYARARAMRALGLPHPWAPRERNGGKAARTRFGQVRT